MTLIRDLWEEEEGADASEYALISALIVCFIMAGMTVFGASVNHLFDYVVTHVVDASIPVI